MLNDISNDKVIKMVIRRKSSIYKKLYELNGQASMFGHDNLHFKTVNLPNKQRLTNLCKKFSVKKISQLNLVLLKLIKLS